MKRFACILGALLMCAAIIPAAGCKSSGEDVVTLRVCNWEEYIDLGDWDEEELIDLESGDVFGENSIVDDFTEWFNSTHNFKIKVEYSTFGTNEDLYNRLSLGDVYDLVCPSDYMIMKLLDDVNNNNKNWLEPYSAQFLADGEYTNNVSPYIANVFEENGWTDYAACYMWGTTGLVYNPDEVEEEDVLTWNILLNEDYTRRVTIKDNVRDAYFATLGIYNSESILSGTHTTPLSDLLNDTAPQTIAAAEDILKQIKNNVYSFETDAGKADMVTGKVVVNYQWSGDAVYIMDEAENDDKELWYAVPLECTNLWFDGWVMLKDGIAGNAQRKLAAEEFVNFMSRPASAIRNMYYIGYSSSIATDEIFEYLEWNYGDDEAEETYEYDVGFFFGGADYVGDEYTVVTDKANFLFDKDGNINSGRQLFAQYPPENVTDRSVIMRDFKDNPEEINQMWINVRCPDLKDVNTGIWWGVGAAAIASAAAICLYVFRHKIFLTYRPKKGYEKVSTDVQ